MGRGAREASRLPTGDERGRAAGRRALYVFARTMRDQGLGQVARHQVRALAEHGWEVDLVARGPVEAPGVRSHTGARIPAAALSRLGLHSATKQDARRRLFGALGAWRLRRSRYAAVLTWNGLAWQMLAQAHANRTPFFLNCGNLPSGVGEEPQLRGKPRWPRIDRSRIQAEWRDPEVDLLVTSEHAKRRFVANGCREERVHAIGRGFDPERFHPGEPRRSGPFRLLFCGRLAPRKGIFPLLELWREMDLKDSELWLCGPIPAQHRARIQELATASVKQLGYRSDVGDVMRQCDAQILLSSNEGQAKALLEGAACGLVTICSPEAGFPFHLGDMGYEVARTDLAAVKRILEELRLPSAERAAKGARAARLMLAHHTWEAFRRRFLADFERALTLRRRAAAC